MVVKMRMWMVDPNIMCKKHLLGEHVELHMMVGSLQKKKNIKGYIKNNLIEVNSIEDRHKQLTEEMINRGMQHRSILQNFNIDYLDDNIKNFIIDKDAALKVLLSRCNRCLERYNRGVKNV